MLPYRIVRQRLQAAPAIVDAQFGMAALHWGDLGFRLLFRKGSSVEDTAIEMIIPRRTSQCNAAIPNCASTIAGAACKAAPAIVDAQFGMAALRAKKATCPAPWSACFLLLDNSGVYEGEVKTLPPIPHC